MKTGWKIAKLAGTFLLCLGTLFGADTAPVKHHHKVKKAQPQLPPLPSGPTGPIQPMPLDSMAPVPPRVTYDNGQLTIDAPNSTLGDILRAVRKQTGAEIDVPDAKERVATTIGPGPAQEVMSELLNGSRFNYVLLGSPQDPKALTRVVLVARSASAMANHSGPSQPSADQGADQSQADSSNDASEADTAQPTEDTSAEQTPEQPAADSDQPNQGVKTPQELLQEMQQRQLQLQQQQQNNPGLNPRTPQQPPQQPPQ